MNEFNFNFKPRQFEEYKQWKCPVQELPGKVITEIEYVIPAGGLRFYCLDHSVYEIYCNTDRMSSLRMDDIHGSLDWLMDCPILSAEERQEDFLWEEQHPYYVSYTYYSFSTDRGRVDLRFIGRDILREHNAIHPCFICFPEDYVWKEL